MDFIERWLHIAPDGGNGMLELAYIVAGLAVVLGVAFYRPLMRALIRSCRSSR